MMDRLTPFRVRVPASTSNLGPGFDTFSTALRLYLEIEVGPSNRREHEWKGDWPPLDQNIFARVLVDSAREWGFALPLLCFSAKNDIPLRRGLGSSAAAITAALATLSHLAGVELSDERFFELALPFEGHPDNLAAAWKGGWVLSWQEGSRTRVESLPIESDLFFVAAIPSLQVATSLARQVLPEHYSKSDLIHTIQRSTLLLHALYSSRKDLLAAALEDRVHQPYRESLIPGCRELLAKEGLPEEAAPHHLGIYLSGSGSTLCSLTDHRPAADPIGAWMVSRFQGAGLSAIYHVLQVSPAGARISSIS